jgi:uncharacterized protein (UPF0212 family)
MGRWEKHHLDWVIVEATKTPRMLCQHCGQTCDLKLPAEAKRLVVVLSAFQALHAECEDKQPAQAPLPLPGT